MKLSFSIMKVSSAFVVIISFFILETAVAETLAERTSKLSAQVLAYDQEHPVNSTWSSVRADSAIIAGERLQATIQSLSAESENACYDRFLVNACIGDVRLQRRKWQDLVRRVTTEAKAFVRQQRGARPAIEAGDQAK
jgi:hypothetical protein